MFAKDVARNLVRYPAVGRPCAAILSCLGIMHYRGRILELCGYLPEIVEVSVPRKIRRRARFRLAAANGTDQISSRLWISGWNGFEQPLPDLFAASVRDARAVLDIGSNSGLYAMIATAVSERAVVHAFEPLPVAARWLRDNARLNGCNGRLKIVEAAVADQAGTAELFVPSGNESFLEMSASLNGSFRKRHSAILPVEVLTVDDYVLDRQIERVDVMKIDVESQEHRVLAGASKVLDSHRPIVFLEVLPGAVLHSLEAIRHQFDYCAVRLRPGGLVRSTCVRVDPEQTNQALCPREKLNEFCALASSIGYPTTDDGEVMIEVKEKLPANLTEPASLA